MKVDHSKLKVKKNFLLIFKAYLTSMYWPGFVSYARANSTIYGFGYFGDGRRVSDLAFIN